MPDLSWRARIGSHIPVPKLYFIKRRNINCQLVNVDISVHYATFSFILTCILLCAGIEPNPGPSDTEYENDTIIETIVVNDLLSECISSTIGYLNPEWGSNSIDYYVDAKEVLDGGLDYMIIDRDHFHALNERIYQLEKTVTSLKNSIEIHIEACQNCESMSLDNEIPIEKIATDYCFTDEGSEEANIRMTDNNDCSTELLEKDHTIKLVAQINEFPPELFNKDTSRIEFYSDGLLNKINDALPRFGIKFTKCGSIIKGCLRSVIDICLKSDTQFGFSDFIVLSGGSSDISQYSSGSIVKDIDFFCKSYWYTNVIILAIPERKDLDFSSYINREIRKINAEIKGITLGLHNTNLIDLLNLHLSDYDSDKIHFNKDRISKSASYLYDTITNSCYTGNS